MIYLCACQSLKWKCMLMTLLCFFANKDLNCVEHTLQNDLNNISRWCANNYFVINPQKTKCMLICSSLKGDIQILFL